MRLATFYVENLFRRPLVLDQPIWAKGRGFGSASSSNARRKKQAQAVAEIYRNRVGHHLKVAVVGDLTDTPDSAPPAPLNRPTSRT